MTTTTVPRSATYTHMQSATARVLDDSRPRIRRATVHALEYVLLPHRMTAYGSYDKGSGPTWYTIDDKDRGWYLHYIWNSRFTGGKAKITHRKSAKKRKKSKETSQRWASRLHKLGLVHKINVPDHRHGGLGPNEYIPLDPSYPTGPQGDALAIVFSGKLKVLTAQPIEIPSLPNWDIRAEKPKPGPKKSTVEPIEELPLPSVWGMAIAQREGLYDRLEMALLWAEYVARKAKGQVRNPGGYWTRMCRERVKQLESEGRIKRVTQNVLPLQSRSPEHERHARNRFMTEQAAMLLAQGYQSEQVRERVMQMVYPAGLCITAGPSESEAAVAIQQAKAAAEILRSKLEQKQHQVTFSAETMGWLRRHYADLCSRPVSKLEKRLMDRGSMTPGRAAQILVNLPNRPNELKQASIEQIEKLLQRL